MDDAVVVRANFKPFQVKFDYWKTSLSPVLPGSRGRAQLIYVKVAGGYGGVHKADCLTPKRSHT